jgi:hypothetical protein
MMQRLAMGHRPNTLGANNAPSFLANLNDSNLKDIQNMLSPLYCFFLYVPLGMVPSMGFLALVV